MPAVVVSGARQAGKSTLVQEQVAGPRIYATLDDLDGFDVARRDPMALVGGGDRITIDEVQREPALLRSIKRAIDQDRATGRFLLTGSANLLIMRGVSGLLAGRASYLTPWGRERGKARSSQLANRHWRRGRFRDRSRRAALADRGEGDTPAATV
jgi:uncharacterized protein